jgi:hypothetical protein
MLDPGRSKEGGVEVGPMKLAPVQEIRDGVRPPVPRSLAVGNNGVLRQVSLERLL